MTRPGLRSALILATASLFAGLGADREVSRLHAPSGRVASFFPEGVGLKVMPIDRFEDLLKAGRDRELVPRMTQLVRTLHSARWDEGILTGRSELFLDRGPEATTELVIVEPWSAAVVGPGGARSLEDGRLAIVVEKATPVSLDWRLRARHGSNGGVFALSVPNVEVSRLTLDLPLGVVPEGPWDGPRPGPAPDRKIWRLDAARGQLDIRLRPPDDAARPDASRRWLEGPTRIDLAASPANWRAEWTVEDLSGAPDRLTIDLDPGLDLLDVEGPRVRSFRVQSRPEGNRVSILLDDRGQSATPLTIRALCLVPAEGSWLVPTARPVDATWTGGRTSIRLDSSRVLQSCAERAGRRVGPGPGDPPQPSALVFEPTGGSGPVADLTFRKPSADASVEVNGHLRLDNESPRIAVDLTWTVDRGRLLSYSADLPPGWATDRVTAPGGQAVSWHSEDLSSGGTRVQMNPAPLVDESRTLSLILEASNRQAGTRGPIDLPRVRPSTPGLRVADEKWLATSRADLDVRPILERGLAWLEPAERGLATSTDLRRALAWRWLAEDAEARVDRSTVRASSRGDIQLQARVAADRLRLGWSIAIDLEGQPIRSIPIHLNEPSGRPIRWRVASPAGLTVEARPLSEALRVAQGFPATGSVWALELSSPARGRIELEGRDNRPWSGSGAIPVVSLPTRYATRGLIVVDVPETSRSDLKATGLTAVDLSQSSTPSPRAGKEATNSAEPQLRRAGMFAYGVLGGRLILESTAYLPDRAGGVVREAFLTTQAFPGGGLKHRLALHVAASDARSIDLTLPPGIVIDRIRRDYQAVGAVGSEGNVQVAIPAPTPIRPSCVVTLDYRTDPGTLRSAVDLGTILPACSMPCLSFSWEVSTPEPWAVAENSPGLIFTDPRQAPSWPASLLGFSVGRGRVSKDRAAILGDLDRPIEGSTTEETTLGEWLLRLDSGRWPMVVDRLAMHGAGWGPLSRLGPAGANPKANPTAATVLPALGLVAVPFDGQLLITSRAEAPGSGFVVESWQAALSRAATTGSDLTDRFQSAARWRGEPTPRAQAAGDPIDRSPPPSGWRTAHLGTAGWPGPGASIRIVDERSNVVSAWITTVLMMLAGFLARNRSPRIRAIGFGATTVLATVLLAQSGGEPSPIAVGLVRGGILVLALWLARALRPITPRPVDNSDATTVTRRAGLPARSAMVGLVLALALAGLGAMAPGEGPILVLIPFDGTFDPQAKPKNVVIRLDDFETLERLARPQEKAPGFGPSLRSIAHNVRRDEPGTALVETRFEVIADGPASWTIPVGTARDLDATINGQTIPVPVTRDGTSATMTIPGPGLFTVVFRRVVPLTIQARGNERIRLPVNSSAMTRVTVLKRDPSERIEVNGSVAREEMELGPTAELSVEWLANRPVGATASTKKPVEAAILWDARPGGDLVRARFRHSEADGMSTLRLAVEPGVDVRGYQLPGLVAEGWEGSPERPEWVARVDPPIAAGEVFVIDLWRAGRPRAADRSLPGFELVGVGRVSGVIGLRRAPSWLGRLVQQGSLEPVADLTIERAWGPLPDDGLTLAGVARFVDSPTCRVSTGPAELKRSSKTMVAVDLAPGRLEATIDLAIEDRQGRLFDLELGLPADFRIVRVDAAGLVDWHKTRERLRLQFEGADVQNRSVQIRGYLAVPSEPIPGESRSFQAKVPWPRLAGVDAAPGLLVVSSTGRNPMEPGDGVVPTSPPPGAGSDRWAYRVERPEALTSLHWASPAAKVVVSILSHLAVDPGQVKWTAIVGCEVSGGSAESLNWKLPADWAKDATLEIDGASIRPAVEVVGDVAYWTITPEAPIWGRSRLVLRSTRPIGRSDSFDYPDVAPRSSAGRGSVIGYDLTIANVSGRPIEVAGSPGLQAVDSSPFQAGEFGPVDHAYHVSGEKWSLRLRVGPVEAGPTGVDRPARVTGSQLSLVVADDGQTWGQAIFSLQGRPATFLELRLPAGADIPWTSVDASVTTALRLENGRWLIPLGNRAAKRLQLVWHQGPEAGPSRSGMPRVEGSDAPTMISVTSAKSVEIKASGSSIRQVDQVEWELGIAEESSLRIVRALSDLDRASVTDREFVLDEIVDFELRLRAIPRLGAGASAKPILDRCRSARLLIEDSGQVAGLDELIAEARGRVGTAPPPSDRVVGPVESVEAVRVRRIGETRYFLSSGQVGQAIGLKWTERPAPSRWARLDLAIVGLVGLAASASLWRFGRTPIR